MVTGDAAQSRHDLRSVKREAKRPVAAKIVQDITDKHRDRRAWQRAMELLALAEITDGQPHPAPAHSVTHEAVRFTGMMP